MPRKTRVKIRFEVGTIEGLAISKIIEAIVEQTGADRIELVIK